MSGGPGKQASADKDKPTPWWQVALLLGLAVVVIGIKVNHYQQEQERQAAGREWLSQLRNRNGETGQESPWGTRFGGGNTQEAPDSRRRAQELTDQGQACWERQDYRGAIQAYESALQIDPNNHDLKRRLAINYNVLGVRLYRAGDRENALRCFRAAAAYDPSNPDGQNNINAMTGQREHGDDAAQQAFAVLRKWDAVYPSWGLVTLGEEVAKGRCSAEDATAMLSMNALADDQPSARACMAEVCPALRLIERSRR